MELEGRIYLVMPAKSGVSQRTGNPWMIQEYVLAYHWFPNQTEASHIVMGCFGEERIKKLNLQPNDEVKVRFHCEAHENNGRWYNELRIDGVTFVGASAYKNQQPVQQPTADATGTVAQAATTATTEPTEQQREAMKILNEMATAENGKQSDLPF